MASLVALSSTSASAHIELQEPAPRHLDQKDGPCGRSNDARSSTVTEYLPGELITVRWLETINHPGHYRISFDPDGTDGFYVPTSYDDVVTDGSEPTILLDDITDSAVNDAYEVQVFLPNIECDNCTLQLVQMMTDKAPYDVTGYFETGNDLYYQCADIRLKAPDAGVVEEPGVEPDASPEPSGDTPTCRCAASSTTTPGVALGALALLLGRRRRRR